MSFPPPWNDGAAGPGHTARQPPPYRPDGPPPPPYTGPGGAPPSHPQSGPASPAVDAASFSPGPYRLARWWQRAAARVIDALAVGIPVTVVAFLIALMWAGAQWLGDNGEIERNTAIVFGIVAFTLFVAYETVCVKRWRRTLGKHLLKLEVAPVSGAGRQGPIPVASMAARAALFNLPTLAAASPTWWVLLYVLLVVPCALWPLWDRPDRQGLHDKLGGTVVVRTD
ncbi:RDD family protein [Streptomonospora alba]|uniref:RDD family protein n=1 Tax=Streptomonospora alba TaxID=183763 RepID=UPI000699FB3E|nr:RDD family protein [Streptomonospora alba]